MPRDPLPEIETYEDDITKRGLVVGYAIVKEQAVITVTGDFDYHTSADFDACAAEALQDPLVKDPQVAVNLSGVNFLGAAGLMRLLELQDSLTVDRRTVVFEDPSSAARRIIQCANLVRTFGVEPSEAA